MKYIRHEIGSILVAAVMIAAVGAKAAPPLINVQGRLTDSAGNPVSDGDKTITFTIYTDSVAGTSVWSETNGRVKVQEGQFNALLGSINPLSDSVFSSDNRWLGIKVGNDPEMVPRNRLVSVAYAQRVATVDGAKSGVLMGNLSLDGRLYARAHETGGVAIRALNTQGQRVVDIGNHSNDHGNVRIFAADGTEPIRFSGAPGAASWISNDGNLGIGLQSPWARLHIENYQSDRQALHVAQSSNDHFAIGIKNGGGSGCGLAIAAGSPRTPNSKLLWAGCYNETFTALSVYGDGRIGINTDKPTTALDVIGTTKTCVLEITGGCDLAEPFETTQPNELVPGALVVIDEDNPGKLKLSTVPYDTKIAGVVSGAGGIQPGLMLKQDGVMEGTHNIALSGRVYVQATASNGPIHPGDRLTSSSIPGHCMKAADPARCDGAVVGKAMSALKAGEGLVLMLVNIQ